MVVELQEQLHAQERELDSREGALLEQEDGMLAFECALGRVRMEYNVECNWVEVVRRDYRARIHTFMTGCRHSFNFDRVLEGRRFLLSMQETDLEWREEKLVEE
jgi:hypothetical protein